MGTPEPTPTRIASLDQFRGYTVAGMFLVNFVGGFVAIPAILKHHNTYCSYADTIMPQFFFAVGFAYRLTFLRRLETTGAWSAYSHMIKRCIGLLLLAFVIYHLDGRYPTWESLTKMDFWAFIKMFKRGLFETLAHIAVTSLWVMPIIAARPIVLIAFAAFSGVLHLLLSHGLNSWPFYVDWSAYTWANTPPHVIDGGPLGFLTWTIPLLVGALAYDAMRHAQGRYPVVRLFLWGAVLIVLGYGISCVNRVAPPNQGDRWDLQSGLVTPLENVRNRVPPWADAKSWLVEPPFVKPSQPVNMWTMSQRAGSLSYLVFGAGFSLAVYSLFVLVCDVWQAKEGAKKGPLRVPLTIVGWILLVIGLAGLVKSIVGLMLVSRGMDFQLPFEGSFFDRVNELIRSLDLADWTWFLVASGLLAVLGWDLRQRANHGPTIMGSIYRTLGVNALAGYILHTLVAGAVKPFAPGNSPLWYALAAFAFYFAICWIFLRYLEKNRLFLKL